MRHFVADPLIRIMSSRAYALPEAELWECAYVIHGDVSTRATGRSASMPKARAPPAPSRSHGELQQERSPTSGLAEDGLSYPLRILVVWHYRTFFGFENSQRNWAANPLRSTF